jgi:hypothetical protein
MLAPKFRFELLRLLRPSCPKLKLASVNVMYPLLRVVPQLFITNLHYSDHGRDSGAHMTHNLDLTHKTEQIKLNTVGIPIVVSGEPNKAGACHA